MNNSDDLIEILLDPNSSDAEKDDAAIELGEFNEKNVIDVLINVSNKLEYSEMVKASCGESLAFIWLKQQSLDYSDLKKLNGIAFHEAISLIKKNHKEWFDQFCKLFPEKVNQFF